jgi:hypothetical protein
MQALLVAKWEHSRNCLPCKLEKEGELIPLKNECLSVMTDSDLTALMAKWLAIFVDENQEHPNKQSLAIAIYNLMKIEQMLGYGEPMDKVPFWTDYYFKFQCENDFKYI